MARTMKISIWQQWGSNHSADFTLVGMFENPQKAQEAASELRQLLAQVVEWLAAQEEFPDLRINDPPTPPEKEIARRYNVDYPVALDWISFLTSPDEALAVADRYVMLNSFALAPSVGPGPFSKIVEQLGGDVMVDGGYEETHAIDFYLTCSARDSEEAKRLEREIGDYMTARKAFEEKRRRYSIPSEAPVPPWSDHVSDIVLESLHARELYGWGAVESSGRNVVLSNWVFHITSASVPAVIAWFQHSGCEIIHITFKVQEYT